MNYSTQISKILLDMDDLVVDDQLTNLPAFTLLFSELEMVAPRELVDRVQKAFNYQKPWSFGGADYASLEDRINAILTNDKNKVKVYTDGMDGHCFRAHGFWSHKMPKIRQAEDTERCFSVKVGDTDLYFKGDDVIDYQGTKYTGIEFYEKITG